jgi:hypothetical protein
MLTLDNSLASIDASTEGFELGSELGAAEEPKTIRERAVNSEKLSRSSSDFSGVFVDRLPAAHRYQNKKVASNSPCSLLFLEKLRFPYSIEVATVWYFSAASESGFGGTFTLEPLSDCCGAPCRDCEPLLLGWGLLAALT